ncbi:methyltransferase domain-containing protein [Candidatus Lucifugimonas marina]|uniref:Methyltransferase domain-containing protein n=2 Tax=Candidatus Lucifugimonas marina TaxID=3038979 RepID=A0AAJ6CUK1_9CHLR|nr:methyltransferase domain-containing protein [SAR202 cluster bacterium JH545]WFG38855.1 methyltransferase domain-containing protein [SAR202 cluster bacterium JH1073]
MDMGSGAAFGDKANQLVEYGVPLTTSNGTKVERVMMDVRAEARPDVVAPAHDMPFEDGEFGVVFAESVLQHIAPMEMVPAAVNEIRRVIAPGGVLVGWNAYCFHTTSAPHEFLDVNRWTYDGMQNLLRDFDNLTIEACGGPLSVGLDALSVLGRRMRRWVEPLETRARYRIFANRNHERFVNSTGFRFIASKGE